MALIQTVLPNHIVLHATLLFIDFYKVFDSIKIEKLDRYYWHMVSPKKLLPLWRCFKKTRKQCWPHLMATGNNLRLCRCNLWSDIGITCCQPRPTDDTVGGIFTFLQSCGHCILLPQTFLLRHHVLSPLANWWPFWEEFYLSAELWSPYSTATNISFLGITCCIPRPTDDPVGRSFTLSAELWSPYSTATNISS